MPRRSKKVSKKRGGRVNKPLEYFGIQTGRYFDLPTPSLLQRWMRGGKKSKRKSTKKKKYNKKKKSSCMCNTH